MHSPFVYNLLTKCLYKKEKSPAFETISAYIKAIKQDQRTINVRDFGAGSRVFKSNARKVSDIAKNAGITKKRAILLNKLTSYLNIGSALELGTSVGISSAAIAAGNSVKLTTIEGCPETAAVAREYFDRFRLDNISLEVGSFEELLKVDREQGSLPEPLGAGVDSFEIQNSKFKVQVSEQTSQESNSKFQFPMDGNLPATNPEQLTTNPELQTANNNSQPTTYNLQPITDNSQLTTDKKSQEPKSKFQAPNSKFQGSQDKNHQNPTTENLQPTTYNLQPNAEKYQIPNSKFQIANPKQQTPNLIYFDGNHQKEATLKYFEMLLPLAHNDSVFIFDDIHWSRGMEEAWEQIMAHPRVSVSIDSFFWGIVFFRQEQEKEHFIIRL